MVWNRASVILRKSVLKLLTTANPTNHREEGGSCTLYTKILESVDLVDMVHSWSTFGVGSSTADIRLMSSLLQLQV